VAVNGAFVPVTEVRVGVLAVGDVIRRVNDLQAHRVKRILAAVGERVCLESRPVGLAVAGTGPTQVGVGCRGSSGLAASAIDCAGRVHRAAPPTPKRRSVFGSWSVGRLLG